MFLFNLAENRKRKTVEMMTELLIIRSCARHGIVHVSMKRCCLLLLSLCISLFAIALDEVRGVETRRVIYEGPLYEYNNHVYNRGQSGESVRYYGWEFTNRDSIAVSVDIELWCQSDPSNRIVKTQTVVLEPKESYIFKREEHGSVKVDDPDPEHPISSYYVQYKAYKLE